jgi:hypothetical protein
MCFIVCTMKALTNDTWTHISVAAERVLTQINQVEDLNSRESQQSNRENEEAEEDANRAQCAGVVGDRKLALGSARVREEGST